MQGEGSDSAEYLVVFFFKLYLIFTMNTTTRLRFFLQCTGDNQSCGLSYHNGIPFSTYDRDISADGDCAMRFRGGWWYDGCYEVNINGEYLRPGTIYGQGLGMRYYCFTNYKTLKATRMMFRKARK